MPGAYDGLDGRKITQKVREDLARSGVVMDLNRQWDHLPAEYRARVRDEETTRLRRTLAEGRAAIRNWADHQATDAARRLASREVGTTAQEARRAAMETRISRLVSSAHAAGSVRSEAAALAERADAAYELGDLDEAEVLATASRELGGPRLAADVLKLVTYDRNAADPAKARAMRDLADVDVVLAAFERDSQAAYSQGLQDSARLARALGDGAAVQAASKEAARASIAAKGAAFAAAAEAGVPYVEPAGVLPGLPENRDPRGAPQPDGATLPEPR
jgi:hypothetical protein